MQDVIPYKRLKDALPHLVDPETGIISRLKELPRQSHMPDVIYFKADGCKTNILGNDPFFPTSGGTSLDRDRALAKAVGEAVERYCASNLPVSEFIFTSFDELEGAAMQPSRIQHYSPQQLADPSFPLHELRDSSTVNWVKTHGTDKNEDLWVPAAYMYCPYLFDSQIGEKPFYEPISTGFASHIGFERAAINGILEVIERDAFMFTWLAMISHPRIIHASLTPLHKELLRRFEVVGYKITLIDATPDSGLCTVIGIVKGSFEGNVPFFVGASTHPDPVFTITKCLEELALMERYVARLMLTLKPWEELSDFSTVKGLRDHVPIWLHPEMIPNADFLTQSTKEISLDEMNQIPIEEDREGLNHLIDLVRDTGGETILFDITSPDIESLGLKVVRSLIPEYIPLNKNYACRPLGNKRLVQKMNNLSPGISGGLNPFPHPFA